jgi:hypothetical protein
MYRRSKRMRGYVNFPVDSKEYTNSNEGGMFVWLVVIPDEKESFCQCCGGIISILNSGECYQGDHDRPRPDLPDLDERACTIEEIDEWQRANREYEEIHYPWINNEAEKNIYKKFLSIGYYAAILVGSTGWSGYSDEYGYWICKLEDLTEEGRELVDMIQHLYPKGKIVLQTWLDT